MVTKSLVEVPFSVHGLIFIESVRGPLSVSPQGLKFKLAQSCGSACEAIRPMCICNFAIVHNYPAVYLGYHWLPTSEHVFAYISFSCNITRGN